MKYAFHTSKTNAKSRNKFWDLTFEEFEEFAISTEYIGKKGKTAESYSIDRIENDKGYTKTNLQILTLSQNSIKTTKTLSAYYDYMENKVVAKVITQKHNLKPDFDDCPF